MANVTWEEVKRKDMELQKAKLERRAELLKKLKEEVPEVDIDNVIVIQPYIHKILVYPDNMKFYQVELGVREVWERLTDLGGTVKMYEELGWNFKLIEVGNEVILVEEPRFDEVHVKYFDKERGHRLKGKRLNLKVGETAKGKFININRKRIYI